MSSRKRSAESLDYDLPKNCSFNRCESGWRLEWLHNPKHILVIRKDFSVENLDKMYQEIISWLLTDNSYKVYIESNYFKEVCESVQTNVCKPIEFLESKGKNIDLIITLGGDGTLLKASGYFKNICPPIMAFNVGTLGFLAPYDFNEYKNHLIKILKESNNCILRNRLCFYIGDRENKQNGDVGHKDVSVKGKSESFENIALNDVVIDRGDSNHILSLVIEVDDEIVTKMKGDGLIISTPTGSTAYSLAAGASIIHPSVRALLVTPINAFSLSMRPILLPVGTALKIYLDQEARAEKAHISFDGNSRHFTISKNEFINIFLSRYPVISMCKENQMKDWFEGLRTCLHWNRKNGSENYG